MGIHFVQAPFRGYNKTDEWFTSAIANAIIDPYSPSRSKQCPKPSAPESPGTGWQPQLTMALSRDPAVGTASRGVAKPGAAGLAAVNWPDSVLEVLHTLLQEALRAADFAAFEQTLRDQLERAEEK